MSKKNIITSLDNLDPVILLQFNEAYGGDYLTVARRVTLPKGEVVTVVPFETEDTNYLVKIKLVENKNHDDDDDEPVEDDDHEEFDDIEPDEEV